MIKTLLIAPRHATMPLAMMDAEVQAVINSGLDVTPHWGDIDNQQFIEIVERNGHELLILITHGSHQGIMLSDGLLPTEMLVGAIRDKFDMVLLNTCDGVEVAQMIQNECNTGVICTIGEIDDRQAFYTGSLFVRELARGKSYFDAYKHSRPGHNKLYIFLAGRTSMREVKQIVVDELHQLEERIEKRLKAIEQRLTIRPQVDYNQRVVLALVIAVILLSIMVAWNT